MHILLLLSCSVVSNSLQPYGLQHTRLSCPSPSPGAFSNSCPLSWWCYPTILSSVTPFSSGLQYFSASESEKWKWKSLSHVWLFVTPWTIQSIYSLWNSSGQNTVVGSFSLLQGIFPTQGLNPGLLHCRRILYQLSHKGNLRVLEWVAYPFSSRSSWPRNWTRVPCIAGKFFSSWAIRASPASESFLMSWLFTAGGQNIGASASASALPMNIQGWFHFGLTDLISLQSKGFSRVFSSATFQKNTHCSITKPNIIPLHCSYLM